MAQSDAASGNGHHKQTGEAPVSDVPPGFTEDASGVTLESGVATARFNTQRGGRLERWQWRTTPPPNELNPATRGQGALSLDLVNPEPGALIDHFLPLGSKPEEFASGTHREFGDFAEGAFRSQAVNSGGEIRLGLLRDGAIRAGARVAEVRMAKSPAVRPGAADLAVLYRVINSSLRPMQILFAVEFNLYAPGLSAPNDPVSRGYYLIDGVQPEDTGSLGSSDVSPGVTHVALVNPVGEMALQIGWDRECDLWRLPAPDGGPGVRMLAVWRLQLPPRDNWAMGLWLAPG